MQLGSQALQGSASGPAAQHGHQGLHLPPRSQQMAQPGATPRPLEHSPGRSPLQAQPHSASSAAPPEQLSEQPSTDAVAAPATAGSLQPQPSAPKASQTPAAAPSGALDGWAARVHAWGWALPGSPLHLTQCRGGSFGDGFTEDFEDVPAEPGSKRQRAA